MTSFRYYDNSDVIVTLRLDFQPLFGKIESLFNTALVTIFPSLCNGDLVYTQTQEVLPRQVSAITVEPSARPPAKMRRFCGSLAKVKLQLSLSRRGDETGDTLTFWKRTYCMQSYDMCFSVLSLIHVVLRILRAAQYIQRTQRSYSVSSDRLKRLKERKIT